jgi:hypothetical protein
MIRDQIVALSDSGISQRGISRLLKCGETYTSRVLKDIGKRSSTQSKTKYDRFDMLDEFTCYCLGLFQADGTMRLQGKTSYQFKITLIDKDVIGFISREFNRKYQIGESSRYGKKGKCLYTFSISGDAGRKIYSYQDSYKNFESLILSMGQDQRRHFLRGFFDGDGCISISRDKRCNSILARADFNCFLPFEVKWVRILLKDFNLRESKNQTKNTFVTRYTI